MIITLRDLHHLAGEIGSLELFSIAGTEVTIGTAVVAGLVMVAANVVSRAVRVAFDRMLERDDIRDPGTVRAGQRLSQFLILLIGVGIALETIGFDLSAMFAAGAVFAVGIGFALQNVTQNFVSGVILLLERSIKPGDVLEVDGEMVRVEQMGIRATVARTLDDDELIIPNSSLVQNTVRSFTLSDPVTRVRVKVGVDYGSDMGVVRATLEDVARALPWRAPEREPVVVMAELADSVVNFELSVWVAEPWTSRLRRAQLTEAVWWALKAAGVVIAFPQVSVHLEPELSAALRALAGSSATHPP